MSVESQLIRVNVKSHQRKLKEISMFTASFAARMHKLEAGDIDAVESALEEGLNTLAALTNDFEDAKAALRKREADLVYHTLKGGVYNA